MTITASQAADLAHRIGPHTTDGRSHPTIDLVLEIVGDHYGYTTDQLLDRVRHQRLAHARHVAMWLAYQLTPNPSYPKLGNVFDRDHTTVMHGCTKITDLQATDDELADTLRHLTSRIIKQAHTQPPNPQRTAA